MFQCIVQQRNGWIHSAADLKDVFPDIRLQLNEQLKQLDSRVEAQSALAAELQELFRRRAEVEQDYSRGLDKLARTLILRHKEQKHKREQWPQFTSYSCWQQLVADTRSLARDHATLAELYSGPLAARLASAAEDSQRVYKACRELCYETHEEILRALSDVHAASKLQHARAHDWRTSANKLRTLYEQRASLKQNNKKIKVIDKEIEKRRVKHADAKLKALKTRSDYLLSLEAANAAIHKYFVDDLSDLIDCMDMGFNNCISRALKLEATSDEGRAQALQRNAQALYATLEAMDSRVDKQKFLEAHHQTFQLPKKISYQGQPPEEEDAENAVGMDARMEDEVAAAMKVDMETRLEQLEKRIAQLRTESDEVAKTLDEAELALRRLQDDTDARDLFGTQQEDSVSEGSSATVTSATARLIDSTRSSRIETEDFYITKFREYLAAGGRAVRLESKASLLRSRLGRACSVGVSSRRRGGRRGAGGGTGLWGALDCTSTGELPAPLVSATRVIARYGIKHPGVFRVSGSQAEISALKSKYERGRDPLASRRDASDIHSVAGLLKLYLRTLKPPLIPTVCLRHLLRLAQIEDDTNFTEGAREFVSGLPKINMAVLRYLFGFLAHVTEHAEVNMMDAWNLAICFGPTLLRVPDSREPVHAQHMLNDLVRRFIVLHTDIFPQPHYDPREAERELPEDTVDADSEPSICDEDEEDASGDILDVEEEYEEVIPRDESPIVELPDLQDEEEEILEEEEGEIEDIDAQEETVDVGHHAVHPGHDDTDSPVWKRMSAVLKQTPDLVVDLPLKPTGPAHHHDTIAAHESLSPTSESPISEDISTVENFLTNQNNTLKKRPPPSRDSPSSVDCSGSPLSARAMAAKFADLTLTGGSLKPTVAAKPPLLRKPHNTN